MLRKQGFDIKMGVIVYIDRDNNTTKECLVPWDQLAINEANFCYSLTKNAGKKMSKGELPEPSVRSKYVCKTCKYLGYCELGQDFIAGKVKKQRSNVPRRIF